MRLQLMTWPEIEGYLKRSAGIILPIGATEQHGPIGLVGTDAICAETLAWAAGELTGAAVGPTLTVGMSEHHMHFPGTITLRPTTLAAVVRDVALALARHGFRRLLFVNGHGMTVKVTDTKMMAHYPLLLHQDPQDTLVICFGMGTTFRSLLSWGIETTAVELVPSVADAFDYYHADADAVRRNPRGHIVVDDGHRFLARSRERYDLISMAHVLEHLPDPVEYLAHLRTTRLTPDGYLLIEVPNLYAHDCFETAHMVSYSANTLSQTLQKAGFTLSAIKIHGQPRSEVIPLYLSILAKAAAQAQPDFVPQPERQVALKRSIGMLRRRWLTKLVPKKAWLPVQST